MMFRKLPLAVILAAVFLIACTKSPTAAETPAATNANSAAPSANAPSPASTVQANHSTTVANNSRVVFILDASGSMLGRVGPEEKMAVARRVLKESINKLPDAAEVGLIAYGHRRKNDCADIEVLSQLKSIDKPALATQIIVWSSSGSK